MLALTRGARRGTHDRPLPCRLQLAAKTLRWSSQGDPQTADPYSQNEAFTNRFSASVHDTLVMRDKQSNLVPALATSWTQVNTTTWRFVLRRGVKFHDGSPLTADDIVFSYRSRGAHQLAAAPVLATGGQAAQDRRLHGRIPADKPNPITLEHATTSTS